MSADDAHAEADAAIARVNAIRARSGQPPVPSTVRNPEEVRAEVRRMNAAARALLSAMRMQAPDTDLASAFDDRGLAAAFDAYECEADPLGLPAAVAGAAAAMAPPSAHSGVSVAVSAAVAAWRAEPASDTALQPGEAPAVALRRIRGGIERAAWHIARAAAAAMTPAERGCLSQRIDGWLSVHGGISPGDPHYEDRLRRAACMMLLGRLTADAGMCVLAHELARRENRCRPWLPIAHVFDRTAFIADRHGANPPAGAVIADLRAELALLEAVPYLPDEPNDGQLR